MAFPIPWDYKFEVLTGWFSQDEASNTPVLPLPDRFGLIDSSDQGWAKLKTFVDDLMGENRPRGKITKLLFLARHGEGWHNVGEEKYGTQAWDDHWSKLNGDGEITWGPDAKLTPKGIKQAGLVNEMWRCEVPRGIPIPDVVYTSPLSRAINTADITFRGWYYPYGDEPGIDREFGNRDTFVLDELHETGGVHTCDKREPKTTIETEYPKLDFPNGFAEDDPTWNPDVRETAEQQDVRSKRALSIMMLDDVRYAAVSAHSGTINSIFRLIGHKEMHIPPGGVVPVIVQATQLGPAPGWNPDE